MTTNEKNFLTHVYLFALTIIGLITLCLPAHSKPTDFEIAAVRTQALVNLSQWSDDQRWSAAPPYTSFFEQQPRDGKSAEKPTTVQVVYDAKALYIRMHMFDPTPAQIRAPYARRDTVYGDQDYVTVYLDPGRGGATAQYFRVNARGVLEDGMFTDGINGGNEDPSPDFPFEANAVRVNDGYIVKIQIPVTSLSYGQTGHPWRIMFARNFTRDDQTRYLSGPAPRDTNCLLCFASVLRGFTPPAQELSWTATPTLSFRHDSTQRHSEISVGIDAKVRISENQIIDATVKPDFSQIELDTPTLAGNTRYAAYLAEKRPFFLESVDIFGTPLQALQTRSITSPSWGLRLTGRNGSFDYALMTAADQGGGTIILPGAYSSASAVQPRSQASSARIKLQRQDIAFGALVSDRTYSDGGGHNRIIGVDTSIQLDPRNQIQAQWLLSNTSAQFDGVKLTSSNAITGQALLVSGYRQTDNWDFKFTGKHISNGFRADNGFISQAGIKSIYLEANRKLGDFGSIRNLTPYVNIENQVDEGGMIVYRSIQPGISFAFPHDGRLNVQWRQGELTRVSENAPLLRRTYWHVYGQISLSDWFPLASITTDIGDQYDFENVRVGRGGNVDTQLNFRLFDRLELIPRLSALWVNGGSAGNSRAYLESIFELRMLFHFTPSDSVRLIMQDREVKRNSALYASTVQPYAKNSIASLTYISKRGVGTAFYFGATTSKSTASTTTRQREAFIKVSWMI